MTKKSDLTLKTKVAEFDQMLIEIYIIMKMLQKLCLSYSDSMIFRVLLKVQVYNCELKCAYLSEGARIQVLLTSEVVLSTFRIIKLAFFRE